MKTVKEWFNELPDGYRELALKNLNNPEYEAKTMHDAISGGFLWLDTNEGRDFWTELESHYMIGTPLPELPKTNLIDLPS